MSTRARMLSGLGLLAVMSLLWGAGGGCGRASPATLRVGSNVWPGYEPLFLARDLGLFGGAPIQLLEFPSSTEVIRAYRNGAIDVAAVTADEALLLAESNPGQRIILVCDVSRGADVILARPAATSMSDLRGRRIGVESGALGAYVLARALELSGMSPQEVQVETVPLNQHEDAFLSGRVEAVVTFEPVRSRLLAAGAHQVFDSTRIPGEIVDVLVTRADLVEEERKSLEALVRGWFLAQARLREDPTDSARRMAVREGTTAEAFRASLDLIEFPDEAENRRLLGKGTNGLAAVLGRLASEMVGHRLLLKAVEPVGLLEMGLLPSAPP